ncbi:MAG: hypothetical protein AB7E46_04290 [Desulfovibrio sp.]
MGDMAWWASFGLVAAASALGGFALGRLGRRRLAPAKDAPANVAPALRALAAGGVELDVMPRAWLDASGASALGEDAPYEPLARCIARASGPDGLICEIFASVPELESAASAPVTCFFTPQRSGGGKINAFETVIASVDTSLEPPRLTLGPPTELLSIPRRRHPRKRVSDQRFVRVRLWLAEPDVSPLYFPDTAPDIRVNAYEGNHGEESAVTDISAGGLALEVPAAQAPRGLAKGMAVVLKCSLFLFREKQFKPYWYAGVVRGLGEAQGSGGAAMRRIAIGFTHVGAADDKSPQGVSWARRTVDESKGERR